MMTTVLGVNACSSAKSEPNSEQQANKEGKKVLVAYFSWSGNTRDAAQYIAQKTGADEFEIIREKTYPTEYTPCT
jgi:fructoselysine-6-P-deglycase FrlB-like protein